MEKIKKFLKAEDGVTAIEYGLIASGIALAIVTVVFIIGIQLNIFWRSICLSRKVAVSQKLDNFFGSSSSLSFLNRKLISRVIIIL